MDTTPISAATNGADRTPAERQLWKVAQDLEATFMAEMLKHAGLGAMQDDFNGGIGEEQFQSFLRQEQARAIAGQGGIGLTQSIFEALKDRADAPV